MLAHKAGQRGQTENCMGGWLVSHECLGVRTSLSQENAPALLKSLAVRHRSGSDIKQHLSRVGTAIAGAYTGRASGTVQISGPSQTTTVCAKACAPIHAKCSIPAPLAPALLSFGVRVPVLGMGRVHTWKEWSQPRPDPQGFCYINVV